MSPILKTMIIIAIILFSLSTAITFVGALAKLQHWSWAGPALIIGTTTQAFSILIGGVAAVYYIVKKK